MRRHLVRRSLLRAVAVLLLLAGCGGLPDDLLVIAPPHFGPGTASVRLWVGAGIDVESVAVLLDDVEITERFAATDVGLQAEFELPSGAHEIAARARVRDTGAEAAHRLAFHTPAALPAVRETAPTEADAGWPRSEWLRLALSAPADPEALESLQLSCAGRLHAVSVHAVTPDVLALDPAGELPPGSDCVLAWRAGGGTGRLTFATAPAGPPVTVLYDRENERASAPFPDDYWLASNPADPSERGLRVSLRGFGLPDQWLMNALTTGVRELDGFSPVGHVTIELSAVPDAASLPQTSRDSLDPFATVTLLDVTAGDRAYGTRVPFVLEARSESTTGPLEHALLLFPSVSLTAGHSYGVVVTRRVRADAGRPFEPSDFFRRVLEPAAGDSWTIERTRAIVRDVLTAAERASPPIERADIAFAARFTIRSLDGITDDLLSMRQALYEMPAPAIEIRSVGPESQRQQARGSAVAAIVRGSFQAPDWRGPGRQLVRDPVTGAPLVQRVREVPFVLTLPLAAREGPVPVVMFQHGNPGSADEVLERSRRSLAAAGFAVIGFTDALNREVSPPGLSESARAQRQMVDLLFRILATGRMPDYFVQTTAEQLAFIRAIGEVAKIPRFALRRSQGAVFGIDASMPLLYLGISEGAHYGPMLLPYAPEVRAAALVAPGRRFSEVLMHQEPELLLAPLAFLGFGKLSPVDVWVVLALIQSIFDPQEPHLFAPHLYRQPLAIDPPQRASVLVVEGVDDSLVPNHATRALARALGPLVQLVPSNGERGADGERAVLGLETARGRLAGNVDADTTAGFYEFVPQGVAGVTPTPGCSSPPLSERSAREGHFCAQSAAEALRQRSQFFRSALAGGAPEIVDPVAAPR